MAETKDIKGWNSLWVFLREKPIIDVFVTIIYFLRHPSKFTGEVIIENWSKKSKPVSFFIQVFLIDFSLQILTAFKTSAMELGNEFSKNTNLENSILIISHFIALFIGSFVGYLITFRNKIEFINFFFLACYYGGFFISFNFLTVFLYYYVEKIPNITLKTIFELVSMIATLILIWYLTIPIKRLFELKWSKYLFGLASSIIIYSFVYIGSYYLMIYIKNILITK